MARWAAGGIIRSSVVTTYQQGLARIDVIHGQRHLEPEIYDAWTQVLLTVNPRFEFTDPRCDIHGRWPWPSPRPRTGPQRC
jgi:hypothetical protein